MSCSEVHRLYAMKVKDIKRKLKAKGVKNYAKLRKGEAIKVLTGERSAATVSTNGSKMRKKGRRKGKNGKKPKKGYDAEGKPLVKPTGEYVVPQKDSSGNLTYWAY